MSDNWLLDRLRETIPDGEPLSLPDFERFLDDAIAGPITGTISLNYTAHDRP
jgi:hypothetical protein